MERKEKNKRFKETGNAWGCVEKVFEKEIEIGGTVQWVGRVREGRVRGVWVEVRRDKRSVNVLSVSAGGKEHWCQLGGEMYLGYEEEPSSLEIQIPPWREFVEPKITFASPMT